MEVVCYVWGLTVINSVVAISRVKSVGQVLLMGLESLLRSFCGEIVCAAGLLFGLLDEFSNGDLIIGLGATLLRVYIVVENGFGFDCVGVVIVHDEKMF